jgi:lipoteichoic acid synthase
MSVYFTWWPCYSSPLDLFIMGKSNHSGGSRLSPSAPQKPGFLSWSALGTTAPPMLLYAAVALYFHIGHRSQGGLVRSLLSALPAWILDLLFVLPIFGLFCYLLSISRKALHTIFAVIYFGLIAFSLIFTAVHYAYMSVTGSGLTWEVVEYWLQSLKGTTPLLFGEATPKRIAWLAIPVGALLIHGIVLSFRSVRVALQERGRLSRTACWIIASLLCSTTLCLALLRPPEGDASLDTRSVAFCAIRDLVFRKQGVSPSPIPADSERFDDPWEFVRDASAPRLNVVLFIFESLSWRATDVYVPGLGATPYLGELAHDGTVVNNIYTVVPHTTKALIPILAGYYPALDPIPQEAVPGLLPRKSLAYILGDQGYATAFFQPANNFEKRQQLVSNLGYDVFRNLFSMPQEGFEDVNYFGKEERMMLRPSLEWVDANRARPFFLTYLTLSSHHQYGVPSTFPRKDFKVGDPDHDRYLNAVRYTDDFLKSVIAEFRSRGLLEETLFIIMGDHGESFGEHAGHRQHNLILWEDGLRTMALLFGPSIIPQGGKIYGTRSILDIIPTACDVLGLKLVKGHFIGESLLKAVPETRKLFFSGWSQGNWLAMREGPIKTIYRMGPLPTEVYDNEKDPFDTKNLAGRGPYNTAFLRARKEEMLNWKASVDRQYLLWKKRIRD